MTTSPIKALHNKRFAYPLRATRYRSPKEHSRRGGRDRVSAHPWESTSAKTTFAAALARQHITQTPPEREELCAIPPSGRPVAEGPEITCGPPSGGQWLPPSQVLLFAGQLVF